MFESRSYRNVTLLLLICLTGVYGYWIVSTMAGVLPVWSDEYFYFVNSRSFIENNTLRAALTFTGNGSLIFHADAHGFAYSLLHGVIGKLVGDHAQNIPLTNVALIFLSLLLIVMNRQFIVTQKTSLAVVLLAFFTVPFYSFTFMQESLHICVAVCFSLLLSAAYQYGVKPNRLILMLLLIVIAGMFRPLWFFWTVGLLPLANNRKQFASYSCLFIISAVTSFVTVKLFNENFPSYFSTVSQHITHGNFSEALHLVSSHFITNVKLFVLVDSAKPHPYYVTKAAIFISVLLPGYKYAVSREKLYGAAFLVGIVNFALLLGVYEAWDWREIRSMTPLFILCAVIAVHKRETILTGFCLVVVLSTFPATCKLTTYNLADHQQQAVTYRKKVAFALPPKNFFTVIEQTPAPLIRFGYRPTDYSLDLLLLPLRTPSGKQIRYAINYYDNSVQRLTNDFVIYTSNHPVSDPSLTQLLAMPYYTLYKKTAADQAVPVTQDNNSHE